MYTVHQLEADFWEKGFDFTYTQGDDGIQFSSAFISSELDKQQHLVLGEGFRITFTEEISFLD